MDPVATPNGVGGREPAAEAAGPVVYVVDDDPAMLAALRRVFVTAGVAVRTFASPFDLLGCEKFADAGALLLDVKMPGMTGLELQREVRARGVTLPIVFLSGSGDIPIAVEAMRDGAFDFVEKPFQNQDLVDRVRKAFASHRASPEASQYARLRDALTPREREVLEHVVEGMTSKEIGRRLRVSHRTVEVHRANVMEKMKAANLADLVRMALTARAEDAS